MTTILAVQHEDKVVIGADARVTAPSGRKSSHTQMVKLVSRTPYIIAGAGECAPCDIAQHIWQPPVPKAADSKDLYHFMISKVVPSLKACFKENEYKWDTEDDETKFAFLVAIGGQVFEIAEDMSVCMDARGFYGVGSGSDYALGALANGADIKTALRIAADYDAYTAAPFNFLTQHKPEKK